MDRRTFVRSVLVGGTLASVGGAGAWLVGHPARSSALVSHPGCATGVRAAPGDGWSQPPAARWVGHQPGRVYLGLGGSSGALDGHGCLLRSHRSYFEWNQGVAEDRAIAAIHRSGRLPWVSFKPPVNAAQGWSQIAGGRHDAAIRERARRYAAFSGPIVVTFHHEPTNEPGGSGPAFATAWTRINDLMREETGLANVAFVPIIGEWEWNPGNADAGPDAFLPDDVLGRAAFLGLDVYEGSSGETYGPRVDRVVSWLAERGYPDLMIGVGETGCTDAYSATTAAQWWTDSWGWVEANPDRVGIVCYFNSTKNSRPGVYWPLDESEAKTDAFARSLESPVLSAPLQRRS